MKGIINIQSYMLVIAILLCTHFALNGITYTCSSVTDIQSALACVEAGDTILIQPGTYVGTLQSINGKSCHFGSTKAGTSSSPITIKSANASNKAVLSGNDVAGNYVFYIYHADYWVIENISITGAQKGIMLDRSDHTQIIKCDLYTIGMEGIHIRDGSSDCRIEDCHVSDTGLHTQGYGEGVYIGTDRGSWDTYDPACHDNVVTGCTFGPNVAAEHIDIKEGTRRTIVEYCTFNGTGITGANSATTYVSCKGIDAIVRYNTGYRNGNTIIDSAFSCNNRGVADSGTGNWFYYNTVYHDDGEAWVVRTKEGTCTYIVWENTRIPAGNMYQTYTGSSYTEVPPGDTETPLPSAIPEETSVPSPTLSPGDANGDGHIDIIDALVTAQYYVGLQPSHFYIEEADVNEDAVVDIVDALLIARYYVGLIPGF
jgi:hypothetical protein